MTVGTLDPTPFLHGAERRSTALLDRLKALHPLAIDLSLGRIEQLLARLGHPERRIAPVIHVAGTNGKGSVVAFLKAIAEAAGQRVHVYTSPHLVDFHERISLAGPAGSKSIGEDALTAYLAEAEAANGGEPITFFEITTAAAFLAFADVPADLVLLETGLGGRLDATNVIDAPLATAITPVSIDHVHFLGDTIEKIAFEKAGILKAGRPGVIGRQAVAALEVIRARADDVGCPLVLADYDYQAIEDDGGLAFWLGEEQFALPAPGLPGRHQFENAGLAIATAKVAFPKTSVEALSRGLETVAWPARLQRLQPGALHGFAGPKSQIWLDGGHNAAAGAVLAEHMAARAGPGPLHLVWGMMATKEAAEFLAPFRALDLRLYTVGIPGEPNAFDAPSLAEIARSVGFDAVICDDVTTALCTVHALDPSPTVLIAGSLYLAGQVLRLHLGG